MNYEKSDQAYSDMQDVVTKVGELKEALNSSVLETSEGDFENMKELLQTLADTYETNYPTVDSDKTAMKDIESDLEGGV